MGSNYQRFMNLLSKWPVNETRKRMDYGNFLRQLLKDKDPNGNIFPGDSVENSAKLDSLYRLLNNTYGKKYPCTQKQGALGLSKKSVETILNTSVVEDEKAVKYEENLKK